MSTTHSIGQLAISNNKLYPAIENEHKLFESIILNQTNSSDIQHVYIAEQYITPYQQACIVMHRNGYILVSNETMDDYHPHMLRCTFAKTN